MKYLFGCFLVYVDEKSDVITQVISIEGMSFHEILDHFDGIVRRIKMPDNSQKISQLIITLDTR